MNAVETKLFGKIEYKEEEILYFDKGLPGFENERKFIIFNPEEGNPISFMQSLQSIDLMFVIANPFSFFPDYTFDIEDNIVEELEIKSDENIMVWGILSIPDEFKNATINLRAPIVINLLNRKGKQVILDYTKYLTKTPLFPHLTEKGGK